jgi:hypothetical protein
VHAQDKQVRMARMLSMSVKVAILGREEMLHRHQPCARLTAGDKREESGTHHVTNGAWLAKGEASQEVRVLAGNVNSVDV